MKSKVELLAEEYCTGRYVTTYDPTESVKPEDTDTPIDLFVLGARCLLAEAEKLTIWTHLGGKPMETVVLSDLKALFEGEK